MAEQQKASDVEDLRGTETHLQSLSNSSTSTTTEGSETTMRVDPTPYINQVAEFKQLADDRGVRIEQLEREVDDKANQIARLNAQLGTERETEGAIYDRKGKEKEKLKEEIALLKGENDTLNKERDDLKDRLNAMKVWQYGAAAMMLVSVILLVILFVKLPCKDCIPCTPCIPCPDIEPFLRQIDTLTIKMKSVQATNTDLNADIKGYREEVSKTNEKTNKLQSNLDEERTLKSVLLSEKTKLMKDVSGLKTQTATLQTDKQALTRELEKLEVKYSEISVRLSKCLSTMNVNGITVSDLAAAKLAQQFRGIYDQDYTMAIDELEEQRGTSDVKETVRLFLDILQAAHKLTEDYTRHHIESMTQSVSAIPIDQSEPNSQDKNKEWVNCTLSKMDWKDFYDLRQKSAWRMCDSMTDVLAKQVARQFHINTESQPKMMTYVRNCVNLCWKTNMHRDPVYIDFYEPEGLEEFDYDTFKPFLYQSGNYMDYVVWPPMFERRGGHMIAKGIAERRD